SGDLRVGALARSLAEILRRHETLRTVFREVEGEPVQVVLPPPSIPLSRIDLSLLPEPGPALREAIREELARPFDLEQGPMARFFLAKTGADEHVLAATFHHIASDGWSMEVFFRDLIALYGGHSPPPLPWRYADFALWQRRTLTAEVLDSQLDYWRGQLADAPPLDLPTDRPRPARPARSGAAVPVRLPPDLVDSLRTFGRRWGITLFAALLTGFLALLSRYSGQGDISVGTPSAGRGRRETENLIGFFANTLVIRDRAGEEDGFLDAAARVRDLVLAAQRNQDVPFERLVEVLQPERDPNVTPLFQAMLTFVSVSREPFRVPGLEADLLDAEVVTAKFDLLLSLVDREGAVGGHLEYGTELFDAPTPLRMAAHFEALLRNAVRDGRISEVPLLSEGERHQLVSEWNDSGLAVDIGCAHGLVEQQAARTPDLIAVEHGDEALSYRELVERARRLAGVLRGAGAGPDVPVGLWVGRSLALPVGVLGVLEAGGACLPLDPSYPADRLALMVADAGLRLVLAEEAMLAELPLAGVEVVVVDGRGEVVSGPAPAPLARPVPDNLVYVLYTSGSTGRPKGVALPHRALVNLIGWTGEVRPDRGLRVLQYSPISFDVSFEELFSTWASGGTLVLIPDETRRDPDGLLSFLVERRIERLFQPFVALQQLAEVAREEGRPPLALRELVTAGEQLRITPAVVDLFQAGGRLFNEYGPTETHVATAFELQGEPGGWPALPPIGRPIGNHRVRLLDRRLQPVPLGVPGELCIGGAGLARGYFRRPDLTAERFVPDPCEPGSRLYRTGDLARLGPGGVLEYLGRIDHQVKLRGFRVELGEIEIVLGSHPRVQEAAVLVRGGEGSSTDRRLVAYATLRSAAEG
ncbi:MAG TPA: amino acid adenylation domain-containing protein, partial [Thermoanaerobaculia bacterium]